MAQENNPFYVEPLGGFGASIADNIGGIAAGFRKRQELEAEKAKQQAAAEAVQAAVASGDPAQVQKIMLQYPELANVARESFGFANEQTEEQVKQLTAQALYEDDPAAMADLIDQYLPKISSSGGAPLNLAEAAMGLRNGTVTPQEVKGWLSVLQPEMAKAYQEANAPAGGELTADMKGYKLARDEGFKGSFIDYKNAVSGRGEKTNLEMMKLQTQIMDIQDRLSQRQLDREVAESLKDRKNKTLVQGINSVLDEVGRAKTEAKGFMTTGIGGALTGNIPGTPAKKLRATIGTIKANIGFDRLQQMRDMSPTGGALGQVAVQELNALQSVITSLDPDMGEERLIEALDKIEEHYSNWKATLVAEDKGIDEGAKVDNVTMTERDRQAMAWARQNPNDPRAAQIMQRLEAR